MGIDKVTESEISKIIENLRNTSYGRDKVSAYILKNVRDIVSSPLAHLINLSITTGIFPDDLKKACITPIFKSGDKSERINYRPISVLPLFAKVFERCMFNRLSNFLESQSLLSKNQYGFRKGKSCEEAICSLTEYIYEALNAKKNRCDTIC